MAKSNTIEQKESRSFGWWASIHTGIIHFVQSDETQVSIIQLLKKTHQVWLLGSHVSLPTFSIQNFCGPLLPVSATAHKKINHQNHRITTKFTPVALLHKRTWGVSVIFTDTSKPSAKLHVRIAQPCYLPYFQKNKYHLKVYMNSFQQNYYPMFITL